MKNIHIHRDTYYISFIYDGHCCFALPDNDQIDIDSDEKSVVVNWHGMPTGVSRKELLEILKEDKTTIVKQFTIDQYLGDDVDKWEAEHDASWL